MSAENPLSDLARAVRESGLIAAGSRGIALVSGGADSVATTAALVEVLGPEAVTALHLNYGLRPDSDEDESTVRNLSDRLGIELQVERPELGEGNVQAEAREARYRSAERLRLSRGADWIATGHTRTDLAETVLYRLATSPGRRGLLGLRPRRGAVVRPLLALDRDEVRRLAAEAGLPFRDDPTNAEPLFARNRIRNEVLPVLREIGPRAEETIAETQEELAEEAEALEGSAPESRLRSRAGTCDSRPARRPNRRRRGCGCRVSADSGRGRCAPSSPPACRRPRAPTSRCSTPRRWAAILSYAPGARGIGCGRSAWAAANRSG